MSIADAALVAAIASPVVVLLVGTGQCGLIWWGLRQMRDAAKDRSKMTYDQGKLLAEIGDGIQSQSEGIRALLERSQPSR